MFFFAIWYHLHNSKNVKNTHGGKLVLVALQALRKVKLLHRCFSRFLNCSNGTKSRKASHKKESIETNIEVIDGVIILTTHDF